MVFSKKKSVKLILRSSFVCYFVLSSLATDACTVFNKSGESKILFGNVENENPTFVSQFHFLPPNETLGKYGSFFIKGENGYIGGGMNDQGLCFDVAAYPEHPASNGKPHGDLMKYLLEDCATVQEALLFFNQYYWPGHCCNHIMIMDKTGSSAVVELIYGVLYIHFKEGNSQVMTNYAIADPEIRFGDYPCPRFMTITDQLDTAAVTVDNFQKICESVHNAYSNALFATIYDPNELDIYFFNPNIPGSDRTKFNLAEEIEKGSHFFRVKNCQLISEIQENKSSKFSVSENVPNPFVCETSFSIDLSSDAIVKISVLNTHGQVIEILENGKMIPGNYSYAWNSGNFPSGFYFCRINMDGIIETRKWVKR
jgi:predicted choloylglycine hydrolase